MTHSPMSKEEQDEREEALAEVIDPMFLMGRGDIDADGELDDGAMVYSEIRNQRPSGFDGEVAMYIS